MSQLNKEEKELFLEYQSIIYEALKKDKDISFGAVRMKSKLLHNEKYEVIDDTNILFELSKTFKTITKNETVVLDGIAGKREKQTEDYFFSFK